MSDAPDAETAKTAKALSAPARRALAEAEARREAARAKDQDSATELGGPKGLEPTRYGDWEKKGITYDF
jgi:hypothetical protein